MSGATENSAKKHQPVAQFKSFPPSNSTLCPKCDYSLIGLASEGRCPECGLKYDGKSHVWRASEKKQKAYVYSQNALGVLFLVILGSTIHGLFMRTINHWELGIHLPTLVFLGIGYLYRHRTERIAILPEGIIVASQMRTPELIRWNNIKTVSYYRQAMGRPASIILISGKSISAPNLKRLAKDFESLQAIMAEYGDKLSDGSVQWTRQR